MIVLTNSNCIARWGGAANSLFSSSSFQASLFVLLLIIVVVVKNMHDDAVGKDLVGFAYIIYFILTVD